MSKKLVNEQMIGFRDIPLELQLDNDDTQSTPLTVRKLFLLACNTYEGESMKDWKIVGEEVQLDKIRNKGQHTTTRSVGFKVYQSKFTAIYKIEPDGDLTAIARINDSKREEAPKDFQITWKKIN